MRRAIVIGERAVSEQERLDLKRAWSEQPVRCILQHPAFPPGGTGTQLNRMLGAAASGDLHFCNLLWPAPAGLWDRVEGVTYGRVFRDWFELQHEYEVLIALGARVSAAILDRPVVPFQPRTIGTKRMLYIPHPSGMSMAMNDARTWSMAAAAVEEVMR